MANFHQTRSIKDQKNPYEILLWGGVQVNHLWLLDYMLDEEDKSELTTTTKLRLFSEN